MTKLYQPDRRLNTDKSICANTDTITPDMLPLVKIEQEQIEKIIRVVPGGARNVQDIYPLSPLQQGLLFHHLLSEVADTYVLSTLLELQSEAQAEALRTALQMVIERHDILRSAVFWEDLPVPLQVVCRCAALSLHRIPPERHTGPIEQLKALMLPANQRMELRHAPLVRLYVASDYSNARHFALLQLHHLVCDHQSLKTVLYEVLLCLRGRKEALAPPAPYRSYVAHALENSERNEAEAFFRTMLGEIDEPTALFGLQDVHGRERQLREASERLPQPLSDRVREQATRNGVSAARLFHAAWALVVACTSGRDDVVFGTVLATLGQADARSGPMLGMAVNTLPLRLCLRGLTAIDLVRQTHLKLKELRQYAHTSLTFAQQCSGRVGASLFTAILNYRHNPSNPEAQLAASMGIRVLARSDAWTNYPVAMLVDDLPDGFDLLAQTDAELDPSRMIAYLRAGVTALVDALEFAPRTSALSLSILPDEEQRRVLAEFNATSIRFPTRQLIHRLFEEQVERHPDALAVTFGKRDLSYAQLNKRANQLAVFLSSQGIGPDQIVALCFERGVDLIVSMLAVWKCGAAYVPVDPAYPHERIAFMLEDAAPRVLLTQASLCGALSPSAAKVISVDREWPEIAQGVDDNISMVETGASHRNLAYVIYTSGSTGRPKGVMVEHATLCNLAHEQRRTFALGPGDRLLQFSALSFDACVWECVNALTSGACLCLAKREDLIPGEPLLNTLRSLKITHVTLPPVAAGTLDANDPLHALHTLVVGGEACSPGLAQQWASGRRFVNAYGPTEATVCSTMHDCRPDGGTVPIGRPIANAHIYILDSNGKPSPIGVAGELHIGGAGVARGYLNHPQLSAERFIADRFGAIPGARLYRSGDLARWCADGAIEFLGRNDGQVKIRGFRIELGEIEAQLMRHPNVREAVVVTREFAPGDRQIVAYFTSAEQPPRLDSLRTHLQQALPAFMIPSAFVALQDWPLTPSGKVDRRSLPPPQSSDFVRREYEPPAGDIEELLAKIWQSVLRIERVGRHDHFFELGGHSLAAMHVALRLQTALELDVPMRLVLECPTLAQLAARLAEQLRDSLIARVHQDSGDFAELLEDVASMPEHQVDELLRKLSVGDRS